MSDVAARVRAARGWKDLDQDELADRLGLERQSVVRTENGRRNPKRAELLAIAAVCEVPPDFMTGGWQALGADASQQTLYSMMERVLDAVTEDEAEMTAQELEQDLEEADQLDEQPGDSTDVDGESPAREDEAS